MLHVLSVAKDIIYAYHVGIWCLYPLGKSTLTHLSIIKFITIIQGYSTGVYTKEEACEKLDTVDLSDFNSLKDNIKDVINDIKKAKKKTFSASPAVEDESSNMVEKPKQRKRKDSEPSVDVVVEESVVG